jgi:hypothetical protein
MGTSGPYLKLIWSCYRQRCSHECHVLQNLLEIKHRQRHQDTHIHKGMAVSLLVVGNFNERRCNLQYHSFHAEFKEKRPVVSRAIRLIPKDHLQDIQVPYSIEPGSRALAVLTAILEVLTSNIREIAVLLLHFTEHYCVLGHDRYLPEFGRNLLLLLLYPEVGGSRFLRNADKYLPQ